MTLAFAAVMGVVLAATGIFIHQRVASNLDRAIDRGLRARAADVGALAQQSDSGLREARGTGASPRGDQFAELIDASGRVLDRTPGLASEPLVAPSALGEARRGGLGPTELRVPDGRRVRLFARPVRAQDQMLVVVVGQTLDDRDQALADLTAVLLVGGPAALVLASLAGYLLTGAALRPVEAMRRRERTFVSDASHELRSPLAVLRTELELMAQERPAGAQLLAAVASAIEETDRLRALTDDLLLLSRADDRRFTVRTASVPAAELLHAAADRARRDPARPGAEIAVDAPADALVLADRDRAQQALDNLVANALRHGDGRLELRARVERGFVELHVLDHGPGFPPGFLPHAWERFARGDTARTDGGAGLGLAIVRTIAELHGGRAEAKNRPGGGADVWISLPRPARPRAVGAAAAMAALLAAVGCGGTPAVHRSSPAPPTPHPVAAAQSTPARVARPSPPARRMILLGRSTEGRPIRVTELASGRPGHTVLVVGCIHGTEGAGIAVTRRLLGGPAVNAGTVWVLQDLNPDGHTRGVRGNARGVDLNRNFPSQWRPIGVPGDPQYAGPRPLSERESRLAVRAIERIRPDITIWFHQPQTIVRAYGHSEPAAHRYARLVGMAYRRFHWPSGSAPNWQNHRFRPSAAFVVELPPGPLGAAGARRHAAAILRLAR